MKYFTHVLLVVLLLALPTAGFAALGDYFVSTEWLGSNREKVVVLDVRKAPFYLLGHIDGAYNVDRSQFLETRNQVKSLVPSAASIRALLSSLGITPQSTIVVYAEDDNPYSS